MFWDIFSLFCLLELYLWYVSLLLCRYISDVHLDLAPVEKSSQVRLIFRNLWWSFLRRLGREFFRRMLRPRVRFIMWIRIRAWPWAWFRIRIRIRNVSRAIPSNHILRRSRRLLQRFNARNNLCRMIKLSRAWIPWRSSTPLSERHAGIFLSGCDNRTILAKHVTSFAPVAQHHLFGEKDIPLDIAMERNFPWQYRWISSRGEDSNMSFPVSDGSIKFVSTFEYRHYLSKVGESEPHCLVTNELRENVHKDRFFPISERTNLFPETKIDFWIAKTALDLCTLKFFLRRFWSKDQNKLWRRNFVQSTYLWLPKIPEYGKYPILKSFLRPPLWAH